MLQYLSRAVGWLRQAAQPQSSSAPAPAPAHDQQAPNTGLDARRLSRNRERLFGRAHAPTTPLLQTSTPAVNQSGPPTGRVTRRSTRKAAAAVRFDETDAEAAPAAKRLRRSARLAALHGGSSQTQPATAPATPDPQPFKRITRAAAAAAAQSQAETAAAAGSSLAQNGGETRSTALRGSAGRAGMQVVQPVVSCGICLESLPSSSMLCAVLVPDAAGSSSGSGGSCSHTFCIDCMRQYVLTQVQSRRHPLTCPTPGCDHQLAEHTINHLLADEGEELKQAYQSLLVEAAVPPSQRTYCPYKDCGLMLQKPPASSTRKRNKQDKPLDCPHCSRSFCLSCGITGWHQGYSCAEFQALPAELRSADDAALLQLAEQGRWKRCPTCGHMVERTVGCDAMICLCHSRFCYNCGLLSHNCQCWRRA